MSRGKHSCDDEFELGNIPWKQIGIIILLIAIIIGAFFGGKTVYSKFIANGNGFKKNQKETVVEEEMPTNLYGYNVLGKMTIKSKNFSKYILEVDNKNIPSDNESSIQDTESEGNSNQSTESGENIVQNTEALENTSDNTENDSANGINPNDLNDALKKGIVKLYGDKINSKGNFCIIGHNENALFSVLNDLKEKDEFELENSSKIKNKYVVTEIYTVEPDDLKCLMPNDKYKEVTLITCTTSSNQRLVVKALEENDYKLSISGVNNDGTENVDNTDNQNASNTAE